MVHQTKLIITNFLLACLSYVKSNSLHKDFKIFKELTWQNLVQIDFFPRIVFPYCGLIMPHDARHIGQHCLLDATTLLPECCPMDEWIINNQISIEIQQIIHENAFENVVWNVNNNFQSSMCQPNISKLASKSDCINGQVAVLCILRTTFSSAFPWRNICLYT